MKLDPSDLSRSYVSEVLKQFPEHKLLRLIMDLGQKFEGVSMGRTGPPKLCFQNAASMAYPGSGYTYVEGYAVARVLSFPVHHAWVIDPSGAPLEVTWDEPGTDYFGVPIEGDLLWRLLEAKGYYGLFDHWFPELVQLEKLYERKGNGSEG